MPDHTSTLTESRSDYLPALGAAVRAVIIFVAVLSIPLTAARALELSPVETSSWILALYAVPGILGLALAIYYRQPLLLTGNLFVIIFIDGLGGQFSYAELIGAAILAGGLVLVIGVLRLSKRLATWIPVPIMFGLLAGAVVPFLSNMFTALGEAPAVVGGTVLAYLLSRALLGTRVPAILPALVAGVVVAAITGRFEQAPALSPALPAVTLPAFSVQAILTATPVFAVLIMLQANLPSIRFLHSQDYDPPEFAVDLASGLGTVLGSLLGPTGVSLSLPATSLVAGEGAGVHGMRRWAAYLAAGSAIAIGVLIVVATDLAEVIPAVLLVTLAGLALVDVLLNALKRATEGPLILGPLFAFVIALSDISFLGFGNFFWSLVIGTAVSLLLERDELRALRDEGDGETRR